MFTYLHVYTHNMTFYITFPLRCRQADIGASVSSHVSGVSIKLSLVWLLPTNDELSLVLLLLAKKINHIVM